jgi:hypothetical protein
MSGTRKADIIRDLATQLKQSEDTREGILRMLALKDAKIDEIDELIINIDRKIPDLIANINANIIPIRTAYNSRISTGCRSDLTWEITQTGTNVRDQSSYTVYTVVKNNTRQQVNFYGQKYYRKPLNRDFGSNIITELKGNVDLATGSGISTIAVTSDNGIEGIEVGDIVTDNLDSPTIFSVGDLPRVTGFGTAPVLGITTTIQGNIGVGSDFFIAVGAGATSSVTVGAAVSMFNILPEGTTVVAIGTADAILPFYDENAQSYINAVVTRPAFQLSNTAVSAATLQIMYVGTNDTKPTLILDAEAQKEIDDQEFVIIRDTKDIDSDFDYDKSPIDPVTIGIVGNQLGIGHRSEIINNGFPPGPAQWREVLEEDEPAVGAGHVFYYTGNTSWPISTVGGFPSYAVEGQTLVSTSSTLAGPTSTATVTSISPTGAVDGVGSCATIDQNITNSEAALVTAVNNNLAEAQRLNALSQALRSYRDEEELQAYGMLQGAAYERSRANESNKRSGTFEGQDLAEFDT